MNPRRAVLAAILSLGVVLGYGSAIFSAIHHGGWEGPPCHAHDGVPPSGSPAR